MRLIGFALSAVIGISSLGAGDIQFEIRDVSTPSASKVIASGLKKQSPKDVIDKRIPGIPQSVGLILLAEGFALKVSTPDKNPIDGFGLSGWSTTGLFSWEWFDQNNGTTYLKRQEGGSLKVATVIDSGLMKIASIEVLSDVSLRLEVSGSNTVSHRILLKKGSVIDLIP
jgi:hypothetical protein